MKDHKVRKSLCVRWYSNSAADFLHVAMGDDCPLCTAALSDARSDRKHTSPTSGASYYLL